jgi:DNA-directed RNA polymerase specialized sigma24 family protein
VLEHFEYIHALARKAVAGNIGPVDFEDIAQEACIKLWLMSQKQVITSPKTYARKILHTTMVDMVRKYKPNLYQVLPADEEGEVLEGFLMNTEDAEQSNPEIILEQKEALDECMKELMNAVSLLSYCQKWVVVCKLKDRVDDLLQFIGALQEHNIDEELEWPVEKVEKQRLYASYSPARRKVARTMSIDMSEY